MQDLGNDLMSHDFKTKSSPEFLGYLGFKYIVIGSRSFRKLYLTKGVLETCSLLDFSFFLTPEDIHTH